MEKEIWTIDDIIKDYEVKGLSGRSKIDFLNSIKRKVEFYDKLNETFGDAHICEIQKEFSKYNSLCEESKCDECPLGVGDGICLKHTFEKKWELTSKPKKYLKWEDLEINKSVKVNLNGTQGVVTLLSFPSNYGKNPCYEIEICLQNNYGKDYIIRLREEESTIFDNLHLEIVKE